MQQSTTDVSETDFPTPELVYFKKRQGARYEEMKRAQNAFKFIFIINIIKQNFEAIYFYFVCNAYIVERSHLMND